MYPHGQPYRPDAAGCTSLDSPGVPRHIAGAAKPETSPGRLSPGSIKVGKHDAQAKADFCPPSRWQRPRFLGRAAGRIRGLDQMRWFSNQKPASRAVKADYLEALPGHISPKPAKRPPNAVGARESPSPTSAPFSSWLFRSRIGWRSVAWSGFSFGSGCADLGLGVGLAFVAV